MYHKADVRYHVFCVDDKPELPVLGKLFLKKQEEFATDTAVAKDALVSQNISTYNAIIPDYPVLQMNGNKFLKKVRSWSSDTFVNLRGDVHRIIRWGQNRDSQWKAELKWVGTVHWGIPPFYH